MRRAAAAALDGLFVLVILIAVEAVRSYSESAGGVGRAEKLAFAIAAHVLALAYFSLEFWAAASVGKMLVGLKIANSDGSEASTATLLNRWTGKWSFVLLGILAIALQNTLLIWLSNWMALITLIGSAAALGESRRAWHDQWAGTAVYRVKGRRQPVGFEPVMSTPSDTSRK